MNNANILELAEHMENLPPEEYDQRYLGHPRGPHCGTPASIAGHAVRLAGEWYLDAPMLDIAAAWLDIDEACAYELFESMPLGPLAEPPTPQDAAETLEHLAATGDVVWRRAER